MSFVIEPVGYIRAPRSQTEEEFWGNAEARIALGSAFSAEALQGLSEFTHAEVLFVFPQVHEAQLTSGARHPRNNSHRPQAGIFVQRGKNRPNRLGSTICRILRVETTALVVAELDAIDGSPVLDIKPVRQEFLPRHSLKQPRWSHDLMARYWLNKQDSEQ